MKIKPTESIFNENGIVNKDNFKWAYEYKFERVASFETHSLWKQVSMISATHADLSKVPTRDQSITPDWVQHRLLNGVDLQDAINNGSFGGFYVGKLGKGADFLWRLISADFPNKDQFTVQRFDPVIQTYTVSATVTKDIEVEASSIEEARRIVHRDVAIEQGLPLSDVDVRHAWGDGSDILTEAWAEKVHELTRK